MNKAQFNEYGNDMHWKYYDDQDGLILWYGYNDYNWWQNVAHQTNTRQRIGPVTGRIFEIDFYTNVVNIL